MVKVVVLDSTDSVHCDDGQLRDGKGNTEKEC